MIHGDEIEVLDTAAGLGDEDESWRRNEKLWFHNFASSSHYN